MSDDQNLIREVEEEVRQDDYKRTWNRYKKYIFFLIIFSLTLVSGFNFLKYKKEKKIEKNSELFFQAIQHIENKDYENAKKILKDINNLQIGGYSDLSFLYILDLVNKKNISLDLNDLKVKKNSKFYGLITLQKFNNDINLNVNSIDYLNDVINLSKPSSIWKYHAHELLSSYYIKINDIDNAMQSLDIIINSEDSGEFIRERAKTIIEMIKKKNK